MFENTSDRSAAPQAFLDALLDIQRALLQSVMTVTVLPSTNKGGSWTDERLSLPPVA